MGTADVVPGRECGACRVCCIAPTIDDPEIQKRSGTRCRHCTDGGTGGCGIYESRPTPCRVFFCAWRRLASFPEDWRPDRTGVYGTLDAAVIDGRQRIALTITLLHSETTVIRHLPFVAFVRATVLEGLPLYLALPGPPGHRPIRTFLNSETMTQAAHSGDAQVCALLHEAVNAIRAHPPLPYALRHSGNDTGI
jgi:hypothetical protein